MTGLFEEQRVQNQRLSDLFESACARYRATGTERQEALRIMSGLPTQVSANAAVNAAIMRLRYQDESYYERLRRQSMSEYVRRAMR